MGLQKDYDEMEFFTDFSFENEENMSHKKRIRRLLEDKLEKKRLRDEFDELDGEFYWEELNS